MKNTKERIRRTKIIKGEFHLDLAMAVKTND